MKTTLFMNENKFPNNKTASVQYTKEKKRKCRRVEIVKWRGEDLSVLHTLLVPGTFPYPRQFRLIVEEETTI